jgi:antitoxin (DNA-binding transcriptional repressor) of toxin-antitoxin stability system
MNLVYVHIMTTVTIHQTKTHLSKLINRVLAGEEIVVLRGRDPVIALKPVRPQQVQRRLNGLPGLIVHMSDDFDAPLADFKEYS